MNSVSIYDCNVWVPGAVIIKSRKIFKAMYHDLVLLEKVGKYKTFMRHLSLPVLIKVTTFYEVFVMFQFKKRKPDNIFDEVKKIFGA